MSEENTGQTLFEKDGFTLNMRQKYKGNPVEFTQWEAKYVSHLELENEHCVDLIRHLRAQLERERDRFIRQICPDAKD